jgi:hypothetical protein
MPVWLQYGLAFGALIVLAPLVAVGARKLGGRAKGGLAMAALFLGLGEVADPPSKHLIEAKEGRKDGPPAPGDPPTAP